MGMKVNGTTGLTFPDTTTLASASQASVRAWVNFNGTGTVAIRASYNVSSITDSGVGSYVVNFTTAMPDANYSVAGSLGPVATGGESISPASYASGSLSLSTSVYTTVVDRSFVNVAIFR
jgi:hypothetical protein